MKVNLTDIKTRPKQREPSDKKCRKLSFGRKGKLAALCGCLVLTGIMIVGGIIAYQTDTDDLENIFLIGDVEIESYEPDFPTKDTSDGRVLGVPDECELMIPFREIKKNPYIKNTGVNDCIVFYRITVPAEIVNLVNDDGTRLKNVEEDLLWLKLEGDPEELHNNHFNENWIRLTDVDGKIVDCPGVNDEGRGRTYIFGYHQRLIPGAFTENVFDKVQNKKYGSRTIKPDEIEQIKVEAFAIQADEVKRNGKNVIMDGELSEEDLTYVYQVFINQNEDTLGKGDWDI